MDPEEEKEKNDTFWKLSALEKLHNITVHICNSAGCIKEFENLTERRILFNNCTKWNSWYFMLSVAIQKESAFDIYIKHNFDTLKKDYFSPKDWEALYTIKKFL